MPFPRPGISQRRPARSNKAVWATEWCGCLRDHSGAGTSPGPALGDGATCVPPSFSIAALPGPHSPCPSLLLPFLSGLSVSSLDPWASPHDVAENTKKQQKAKYSNSNFTYLLLNRVCKSIVYLNISNFVSHWQQLLSITSADSHWCWMSFFRRRHSLPALTHADGYSPESLFPLS